MSDRVVTMTQRLTYFLVCLIGFGLIAGSFLLRFNYSEEATSDEYVIKYAYHNISEDPAKRNYFRHINVKYENLKSLVPKDTKSVRIVITRTTETGSSKLQHGKVFSIILEDMAKFKSVLFDYERCIVEVDDHTEILLFLFIKKEGEITLRVMVIDIDRVTDKISILGKELSAEDIGNGALMPHLDERFKLDKGYLNVLLNELKG